jgi:hypothetical protein
LKFFRKMRKCSKILRLDVKMLFVTINSWKIWCSRLK